MEISSPSNLSSLITSKTESLGLKLNQQLEVKVISSKAETQTLVLLISQSNKPIQVQSNLPIKTEPGQTLQLIVTKTAPSAEFKIANSQSELTLADTSKLQNTEKPTHLKELLLKQIIPKIVNKNNAGGIKTTANATPTIISAKIISVNKDNIQVKLYTNPTAETIDYTKSLKQNVLQQHNPIVSLKKEQLSSTETIPTLLDSKKQAVERLNYKPGQKIQLEINKVGSMPEFKIINQAKLNLIQDQIYTAKVIDIKKNTIQLRLFNNEIPEKSIKTPQSRHPLIDKPSLVMTVSPKQLGYPPENTSQTDPIHLPISSFTKSLKPEQQLILEVKKTGIKPEFKIIETSPPKLNAGQIISAKVINIKHNKVQLQLEPLPPLVNSSPKHSAASDSKPVNHSSIITLHKNQLTSSLTELDSLPNKSSPSIQVSNLKQGQQITLEIVKTTNQTEFKLIENGSNPVDNRSNPEQKIQETIKQVLPIQETSTELLNQIIKNLPTINKNEKIPDTLKRLAREIIESLPQIKNLNNPRELKQAINQSGQFLEAKLVQYAEQQGINLGSDFKNQLLKLQQAIKQELELTKEQKTQSNDVNLIKEMQQKTENTLAKIILNQLTSLPKDEGSRQIWIVDLPFISKDVADSVKIEIDHKQTEHDEHKQNWSVNITITPPGLATIHCKISCFDNTINTRFWSDEQETVSKIFQNLDFLKTQFETAGIKPGQFSAHKGQPLTESHNKLTDQSLFDQKA